MYVGIQCQVQWNVSKGWQHINSVYQKEERADTKHKGHPMPEPEKYLENMYKVARSKR